MVGGWSLTSKNRERYITQSLSRVYLANPFGKSITAPELLTVNGFHRTNFPDKEANVPMLNLQPDPPNTLDKIYEELKSMETRL